MGISCKKTFGEYRSMMKKLDNQIESEKKYLKEKKENRRAKNEKSRQIG